MQSKSYIIDLSTLLDKLENIIIGEGIYREVPLGVYNAFQRYPITKSNNLTMEVLNDKVTTKYSIDKNALDFYPKGSNAFPAGKLTLITSDCMVVAPDYALRNNLVSRRPYMPVSAIDLVNDVIDVYTLLTSDYPELYVTNPLTDDTGDNLIGINPDKLSVLEVLEKYVSPDKDKLSDYCESLIVDHMELVYDIIASNKNNIWYLDAGGVTLKLISKGNVKYHRYNEMLDNAPTDTVKLSLEESAKSIEKAIKRNVR